MFQLETARRAADRTTMSSSTLWQNDRKTVVLLDLPRSIEEAQVPSSRLTAAANEKSPVKLRRLVSAVPPACPFLTPEPKSGSSGPPASSPSAQVAELMTQAAVESALEEIVKSYDGPWCLPRIFSKPTAPAPLSNNPPEAEPSSPRPHSPPPVNSHSPRHLKNPPPDSTPTPTPALHHHHHHHLPPNSVPLHGTITTHRQTFLAATTPNQFHLILLDPPWPNRSAKRKRTGAGSYRPAADLSSIRLLLSQIPVASRLAPGGLVAVWLTNAARFSDLLAGPGGVFAEWDVELVGEWTWLKVTTGGEPVVGVGSRWRKPWERLLIARRRRRRRSGGREGEEGIEGFGTLGGKVIVSVPDVHSRKPNLRGLFEGEGLLPEQYEALEVFARNLTAGWWAWGDEVLAFQDRECWVDEDGNGGGDEDEEGGNL